MGAEILQSMTYLLQAEALLYNIPLTYNGSILEPGSSTYHTKECREGSALGGSVEGRKTLANYSEIGNKMSKGMQNVLQTSRAAGRHINRLTSNIIFKNGKNVKNVCSFTFKL